MRLHTAVKVYRLSLRWRSCVLNDPYNEKNNMGHPSRIKNNRIPGYTWTLPRPHPCQRLDRSSDLYAVGSRCNASVM